MNYIVELEPGVWIGPNKGDPPWTLDSKYAREYSRYQDAMGALTRARKHRPFADAVIIPNDEDMKPVYIPWVGFTVF